MVTTNHELEKIVRVFLGEIQSASTWIVPTFSALTPKVLRIYGVILILLSSRQNFLRIYLRSA